MCADGWDSVHVSGRGAGAERRNEDVWGWSSSGPCRVGAQGDSTE